MGRVGVRKSPIHGLGLFALYDIPPGDNLTYYDGERLSRYQAKERDKGGRGAWLCTTDSRDEVIDGLKRPIKGRGMASFANHSGTPNALGKNGKAKTP
jgi:SET domain-containing protein